MAHQHFVQVKIQGLPSCVLAGYAVPICANDSLTYWLPDRIKTVSWVWKAFHDWVSQILLKMHKRYSRFYRFLPVTPFSIENSQFLKHPFNHLKINCTKLLTADLKFENLLSFLDAASPLTSFQLSRNIIFHETELFRPSS